ncbi:S-adenosyl-L-methionine-dependent methyltransferase [Byssothecium circinans]|uniref:S-adenosyl-L-methionine-dependent methyltransferase n=1 Tax=Byssothecium circinans TaxID=147558 RepID=A0A6A5TJQ5_9PLEO|nr:S-adenosyl-L-methionine-dependent methyltransferase [Byssothecium circinans]
MTVDQQQNGEANGLSSASSLLVLSEVIAKNASIVSHYLEAHKLPQPSFNSDGPSIVVPGDAAQEIRQAQQDLISAALKLSQLAIGPSEFLPQLATGFHYISCLEYLCQYDIFHRVPLHDAISYVDLANVTGVPEQRLKSVIRMAMTNALFREEPDGKHVRHSATSAFLASDSGVHNYASYMCARSAPMALSMAAAHKKWGADTMRTYETAYNAAFKTDLPFFDHIGRDKELRIQFPKYMNHVRSSSGLNLKHLVDGVAWQNLPDGGTVVDVGGSTGGTAIALAKAFPHLNFIVQDLPVNAENGRKAAADSLPSDILSRLKFQGHDFTNPQPVKGADIYLLRMILHDWPDTECVTILKKIVAAMDNSKSRLLIMDTVLPKPGSMPVSVERVARARDLTMLQMGNSKERDLEDWNGLIRATDEGLELVNVVEPFGSTMAVLEVKLR